MAVTFSKNPYVSALALDSYFPSRIRRTSIKILGVILVLLAIVSLVLPLMLAGFALFLPPAALAQLSFFSALNLRAPFGLLLIVFVLWFVARALDSFYNAKTFQKRGASIGSEPALRFNLFVSELWWHGPRFSHGATTHALFAAFTRSQVGRMMLARLGIDIESFNIFLSQSSEWEQADVFADGLLSATQSGSDITLGSFSVALFGDHAAAKAFLDQRDISLSDVEHTGAWLEHSYMRADTMRRWWLADNLARIPGIGKEWSYAQTPLLEQYGYDMEREALRATRVELIGKDREIKLLESALLEESGANAIIVGEAGAGRHTVLAGLAGMIVQGTVFPDLENKRVFKFDGPALVATAKTKGEIEATLIKLLNEATEAGNIILAIDEFPEFVASLDKAGVNAGEILVNYLASPAIHIVALADTLGFRKSVEVNAALMKYFERIEVSEPDLDRLIEILEDHAPTTEGLRHVLFTYNAIEAVAHGATEHLVAGALPERAIDLLEEVAEAAQQKKQIRIDDELVEETITQKKKIPHGPIKKFRTNQQPLFLSHLGAMVAHVFSPLMV